MLILHNNASALNDPRTRPDLAERNVDEDAPGETITHDRAPPRTSRRPRPGRTSKPEIQPCLVASKRSTYLLCVRNLESVVE